LELIVVVVVNFDVLLKGFMHNMKNSDGFDSHFPGWHGFLQLEADLDGTILSRALNGWVYGVTASEYCHFIIRIMDVVVAHGGCM
jgi:hypothetical protein